VIPDDFIQTLLARIDIVEVIDRFVPLKKAGANYVACCPFHKEKTPSFSVSQSKQFYHCFGCGAHGTAIGFLMAYGGKSFPEAVEDLARDAGLTVPNIAPKNRTSQVDVTPDHYALMRTASDFYRAQLREWQNAIAYLKGRGIDGGIAKRYGIGYAPEEWQSLKRVFSDYESAPLDVLGLTVQKEDGRRYDRFRGRIMFPILDMRGKTIAFGGRVIGQDEPKYLNSPETPLFSKGRELYGLFQAREAIRRQGCALVVEGYMDVIALAQHGIDYCVATLGTATTSIHTQKLYRLTDSVIFCFDGDQAGRHAAWRALTNTIPTLRDDKRATFLFLPEGLDPDDFVRQYGREAFEDALSKATPLSEYLLTHLSTIYPPRDAEGCAAFINALRPLLTEIKAPALAALLRKRVGALTGLPENELRSLLKNQTARPSSSPSATSTTSVNVFRPIRRPPSLIREVLQAIVQQPHLTRTHDIPHAEGGTPEAETLNAVVAYCHQTETLPTVAALIQYFSETAHAHLIRDMLAVNEAQNLSSELNTLQLIAALQKWEEHLEQQRISELFKRPLSQLDENERRLLSQMRKTPKSASETVVETPLPTPEPETNVMAAPRQSKRPPPKMPPDDDIPPF
jgi:DNA primase